MRSMAMATPADVARDEIFADLKPYLDKTELRIFGKDVAICVFSRAGKVSAGGIEYPKSYKEDEFQGITGLVIALGPLCSGIEFERWFGGRPPQVGDWIGYRVQDGIRFAMGGQIIRLIQFEYLRFGTNVPDLTM